MATKCKNVTIKGKRRKLCWGSTGKKVTLNAIISNEPASGRRRAKKKTSTAKSRKKAAKGRWVRATKSECLRKSGPKKGKMKKGCKIRKGGGYMKFKRAS